MVSTLSVGIHLMLAGSGGPLELRSVLVVVYVIVKVEAVVIMCVPKNYLSTLLYYPDPPRVGKRRFICGIKEPKARLTT